MPDDLVRLGGRECTADRCAHAFDYFLHVLAAGGVSAGPVGPASYHHNTRVRIGTYCALEMRAPRLASEVLDQATQSLEVPLAPVFFRNDDHTSFYTLDRVLRLSHAEVA